MINQIIGQWQTIRTSYLHTTHGRALSQRLKIQVKTSKTSCVVAKDFMFKLSFQQAGNIKFLFGNI